MDSLTNQICAKGEKIARNRGVEYPTNKSQLQDLRNLVTYKIKKTEAQIVNNQRSIAIYTSWYRYELCEVYTIFKSSL